MNVLCALDSAWAAPFAYITNLNANSVSVIDSTANTLMATMIGAGA